MPRFFRPMQDLKPLDVIRIPTTLSSRGRPLTMEQEILATIAGVICSAEQKEVEQWKQAGHPITHEVVQEVDEYTAPVGCYLRHGGRLFEIQGKEDPGELRHFCVYFCLERLDLYGQSGNPGGDESG